MDDYGNELYLTDKEYYQSLLSMGCYGGYGARGYWGFYSLIGYV